MAKILAVDDSVSIRTMMEVIGEKLGHVMVTKPDGREALDWAKENLVDLVITDLNMPEMGGMSLVAHLRRLDSYHTTPILVMTTETADYKKQKAKTMGATGWIAKPVTEDRIETAIKKTIG